MGGKASAPPTPDYVGAAQQTAEGNLEAARSAANANRVNQYSPYGSSTWTKSAPGSVFDQTGYDAALAAYNSGGSAGTPGHYETTGGREGQEYQTWVPGTAAGGSGGGAAPTREQFTKSTDNPDSGWSQTTTLSPDQQKLFDADTATKLGLSSLAGTGLSYVQDMLGKPFDQNSLPAAAVNPGETAQAAILRRIQPNLDRDREALRTQLLNQGLTEGSSAYTTGLHRADEQANDAYSQAALQGISVGQQARQQGIQEQNFFRNEPLNTLNAVRTGSQVVNPTFGMVPQQATTAGPDILGATQAGYTADLGNVNAKNASGASTLGGLASLGSTAAQIFF